MESKDLLSFSVGEFRSYTPPLFAVTPSVDGSSLSEMVTVFEQQQGFEPAGSYGGLIPDWFNYGRLDQYFLGRGESSFWAQGVYLLGCECGEVGCWPLQCQIRIDGNDVVWEQFSQPYRPERDYSSFGPFVFDGEQYRKAVADLEAGWPARHSR
jgi:hypothetical protein